MRVILPMHHRSPNAAGTVPTRIGGVLAELAEPAALLGAVIAHPSGAHDVQFQIHGAPEAVSKVTAWTAPAAAMGRVTMRHCRMGIGECAPLTVGVAVVGNRVGAAVVGTAVGAAAHAQSLLLPTIEYAIVPDGSILLVLRECPQRPKRTEKATECALSETYSVWNLGRGRPRSAL